MLHLALALAPLLAPPAPQAEVWVVDAAAGPGHDFVTIEDAVDAASDGDVVLVRSGFYFSFPMIGKSVSVVADVGAHVGVSTFPGINGPMQVYDSPAGSTTAVRGIDFQAPVISPTSATEFCVDLQGCQGTVWLEDCTFTQGSIAPILIGNCEDVVLERCTAVAFTSASPAVLAENAHLSIHGGAYTGGDGEFGSSFGPPKPGRPGIHLQSGELDVSGCVVTGGAGGLINGYPSCPSSPPDGGPGVRADDGVVRVLDAALVGGAPGVTGLGCTPLPAPGPPFLLLGTATLTQLQGTPAWLASSSPVREGQTLTLRLTTSTGTPLTALLLAGQAADPRFVGPLAGVGLLAGPTQRIVLGTVDPLTGIVTFQLTVPELGPGVLTQPWIFQAFVCGSGGCTAGAATHTVWLDSSL